MSFQNEEYFNKIITLLEIQERINKIEKNFTNFSKRFIFPKDDFDKISNLITIICRDYEGGKDFNSENYNSFLNQLSNFSDKIKSIFFEKDIFKNIKDEIENINKFQIELNGISFEHSKVINASTSLNMFDETNENKKSFKNFSYINNDINDNKNLNNISSDSDYQIIPFGCLNCKNTPHFYCKNHCYQYICKYCREIFKNTSSHQFEEFNSKRENEKILFINSFIKLLKIYCQNADKIFKSNQEKIDYPILKNFNNLDSQTDFLKSIYNFEFEKNDSFDNSHQTGLCQPIKDALIKIFELNKSELDSIEDKYDFINEKYVKDIKVDYMKIKRNFKYKSYYANILIKNQYFLEEINKVYIEKNFPECKFFLTIKSIINELIINQCKISKNKLNNKYNFIIPNINLNLAKGGEIYYPPYGWFGIGLNIENKYQIKEDKNSNSNDSKAIAYFALNGKNNDEIKLKLNNLIMGRGIKGNLTLHLYNNINIAEQKTGSIFYNNKKYKIALMARVLSNKIKQIDGDKWALRENDIEFIRIIFKEIMI